MPIRPLGNSSSSSINRTGAADSLQPQTGAKPAAPGASDVFGEGPKSGVLGSPALPAAAGFDYSQLSASEQHDLAQRSAAAQLGIELPTTRDSIAAVFNDDDVARLVGRSVMTQGDVSDMLKGVGLPAGDTLDDPQTQKSLARVQEAFGLPITGKLDADTLLALLQAKAADDRRTPAARKAGGQSLEAAAQQQRSQGGAGGAGGAAGGAGGAAGAGGTQGAASTSPLGPVDPNQPNALTPERLMRMSPGLSAEKAAEVAPGLNAAMQEAGITTPERQAAFVAQVAHESGNFRYSEEIASGRAYEGRRDLGNTQPGDGERFKGRGYIQLTGRANYAAAGRALGLDLVNHPELASRPENAGRVAAWFWNSRGLNAKADAGDFAGITRSINGGQNGAADRNRRFQVALANSGAGGTSLA